MKNFIDLTGQRFERLLVVERAEDHISKSGIHTVSWLCECDCGKQIITQSLNLRNGHIKSCGCLRSDFSKAKLNDLTGNTYGKLTVLERAENHLSPKGGVTTMWKCACNCGNVIIANSSLLKTGKTRSCGCLSNDKNDISGIKYGMLTAILKEKVDNNRQSWWIFRCDCGKEKVLLKNSVTSGNVISCGCFHKSRNGLSNTRIYGIWKGMIARCYNKNSKPYSNYGGRGITVCKEWREEKNGFTNFYEWSVKHGYDCSLSIDRKDNDGNYNPENCRWATSIEQNNNTRNTRKFEYNGKFYTLTELSNDFKVKRSTIDSRLRKGKTIEEAIKH